ncbi:glycosyltransferase family 31 protein [Emericellopsis atlantica]|uniref:Glycosyltransferase family 31 protein n=1 Tax=Emericellopsis atlantica TaxID=2614577 RepID=A0A9P8CK48_9HYPO|nr:glycosyltransferase family 31 protein [Emericellopsis atlantica]KAG9249973.1 glycosyltransferase family 31 protein [Emericellopsis atlantica]
MINPTHSLRVALLLALTTLLTVTLWELNSHPLTCSYDKKAKDLYDPGSLYSTHEVYNNTLYQNGLNNNVHAQHNFSRPCEGFPDTTNIMFIMKTGASEAFQKLPTQLLTTMSCLPDFLIFSDLEQQIGKYHLYDALDRVSPTLMNQYPEFELYKAQKFCPIPQHYCAAEMSGGWDLDKYKFLNIADRVWQRRPGMDWYVFAEADTYIVWSNMVQWLREEAPKGPQYLGNVALLNEFPFAHGGSGYVVSGELMKTMANNITDLATKYDERAGGVCCGDFLFAKAASEVGTNVQQVHPMFNGERPLSIPYGHGQWCEPIISMHHVSPEEVSTLWQFEQTRKNKSTLLIKDIYEAFMAPSLTQFRQDWDNLSDDTCFIGPHQVDQENAGDTEKSRQKLEREKTIVEKEAHKSPTACAKVCEADKLMIPEDEYLALSDDIKKDHYLQEKYEKRIREDVGGVFRRGRSCFQWRYHQGACCISQSFKLGMPRHGAVEDEWTSGFFVKGIKQWIEARGECLHPDWREPYLTSPMHESE